jgi:hypothetical protein
MIVHDPRDGTANLGLHLNSLLAAALVSSTVLQFSGPNYLNNFVR